MKTLICVFLLWPSAYCFGQATHSVTVLVNQPPICTVVSLEHNSKDELSVYPNPANETISIKGISEESNIDIHDPIGRIVLQRALSETDLATLNVSFLPKGVYFIRVRTGRRLYQSKLIIE